MRHLLRTLPLLLVILLSACGGGDTAAVEQATLEATRTAQETAYQAMMDGHDRVMPMMGKLTSAERTIAGMLEAGDLEDSRKDLLEAAKEQLTDANDDMMEWMKGLKSLDQLRSEMDNDAIMTYLKEEAADIAKVEMAMTAAYANANELLGNHDGHDHDHGDGHDHNH